MEILTQQHTARLIDNARRQEPVRGTDAEIDFEPVVRLFDPCGAGTWLLTEIDAGDADVAWGLCDLGVGCPEFGTVSLAELRAVRGPFGLGIERDLHWKPTAPISAYIDAALAAGRIVEPSRQAVLAASPVSPRE